jgi:AhpD family alkylhydroperoxidase
MMSRLQSAPAEVYEPLFGSDAPIRKQVYALRPPLASALTEYMTALATERILPDRLIELVRIRIAFHNQCRSCMAVRYASGAEDGVTEQLVCSLERPEEADDLTEAERAALAYADLLATDHLAIDDAVIERLREHFEDAEIVELCLNSAVFVGMGRATMSLDMTDDLPAHFRAPGTVTPWGADEVLREGHWGEQVGGGSRS